MSRKLPQPILNETKDLVIKLIEQLEKEGTYTYKWEYGDWAIQLIKK